MLLNKNIFSALIIIKYEWKFDEDYLTHYRIASISLRTNY